MKKNHREACSIGIIGGANGPTAIFISGITKETKQFVIEHMGWWRGHLFLVKHRIKNIFNKQKPRKQDNTDI